MRKFGLLGYPLGHSLSGYIHGRIFEMCGLTECEYNLYEVKPEELSLKSNGIKELLGFNVTIPYKTAIIPYLDRLDKSAEGYGAVNCIMYKDYGEAVGYNTDGYGFLKSMERLGVNLSGKQGEETTKVLLLGCGGVGRMMAIEAVKAGAEVTIAIRRNTVEEKAAAALSREIIDSYGSGLEPKNGQFITAVIPTLNKPPLPPSRRMRITYTDTLNKGTHYDLLLNATPCGMHPDVNEIPLVPEILSNVDYLFDAIYNPTATRLIIEAQKRGVKTLNGMAMLVEQAVKAEQIWNGIELDGDCVAELIAECESRLS